MIFDMFSDEFKEDPYKVFKKMRREAPVCRANMLSKWAVFLHDDVKAILQNPKLWSSSAWAKDPAILPELNDHLGPESMISMDPPRHTRLRRIIAPVFGKNQVSKFEGKVRSLVENLAERMLRKDEFDFVRDFSMPLPMTIISDLLGVEAHRGEDFKEWTRLTTNLFPVIMMQGEEREQQIARVITAQQEFTAYLKGLIEARRREPKDDLLSRITHAKVDGDELSLPELNSFAKLLLVGGNETTQNLIGNIMILFKNRPDLKEQLIREPEIMDGFIDEALRYCPPVYGAMRTPTTEVEMHGEVIRPGEKVFALMASADHDESVHEEPEKFDVHRDHSRIMPFGLGVHTCLGLHLAKLEVRVALETLLPELERMEITDFAWLPSALVRGPEHLTVRYKRSPASISLPSDGEVRV